MTNKGRDFLKDNFHSDYTEYPINEYEIVYWRKNYNMRGRMIDVFSENKWDKGKFKMEMSLFDLAIVVEEVLKYFLDEKNWEYSGYRNSIWEWHTEIRNIADQIYRIRTFLETVSDEDIHNEDVEIYFYDSY